MCDLGPGLGSNSSWLLYSSPLLLAGLGFLLCQVKGGPPGVKGHSQGDAPEPVAQHSGALSLAGCTTLVKLINLSEPQMG